ncbi:MAG: LytTR family transcriptional regulator [Ruminococcaceae bacterium]|nr:LytTR family transcriptional regulator [Oscillospiraceae bacterium]
MIMQGGMFMKFSLFIDENHDEEVIVYVHSINKTVEQIKAVLEESSAELIGYKDKLSVIVDLDTIVCFSVENNRVYAITTSDKLYLKNRLYQLEQKLPNNFIKINQSCIANIKQIKCFDSSISGTLLVKFKNGFEDYVSRRQIKFVKERLGL